VVVFEDLYANYLSIRARKYTISSKEEAVRNKSLAKGMKENGPDTTT
jgi:hypothetical protein